LFEESPPAGRLLQGSPALRQFAAQYC